MKRFFGSVVLVVVLSISTLLFLLPTPTSESVNETSVGSAVLIENVYLTDSEGERTTTSILMKDGYIRRINQNINTPADTVIIDGSGLTAIAGLIDSHTHSYGTALEDALRFGVTTSVDMFSPPAMLSAARLARQAVEPATEADLFSAGMLATAAGGHGTQFGIPIDTLSEPEDAPEFVRARIDEGSDFIKLVYMPNQSTLPSLDRATAKAVIDAAHTQGLLVVAHISTQKAASDMVEDGVNGLVHIFADELVNGAFIELAVANDIFVVPTLAVIASIARQPNALAENSEIRQWLSSMQKQTLATGFPEVGAGFDFDIALQNVNRLHDAGVRILAGSDAPNPGTAHGLSLHHELALLVQAGSTPTEAMRAATDLPASVFGLGRRGVLEPDMRADLLLVHGNPYQNIGASHDIEYVIKNGYVVPRETSVPETAPAISSQVLGTFDEDLGGPDGLVWDVTVDAIAGGNSTASASRVRRAERGHALAVKAEVKPGFAYPWAGVGLGSSNPDAALDVSGFSQVVFDVRGMPGTYRFMLFSGAGAGVPPTQEFAVTGEWQTIRLPLANFTGFEPKAFSMLGIVAGPMPKAVEYMIDEVRFEP